jgi:serine protease Do
MIAILAGLCSALQAASGNKETNGAPRLNLVEGPISREVKINTSLAPVIKKVGPSVVNIYSTMIIRERRNRSFFEDPFRLFGEDGDQSRPRVRRAQSLGSGVIISPDGYILTANHVVEGADKVRVALASGGKEFDAKVIGTDPPTDVAVLKVDAKELPAVNIADSDKLEVGDLVLAIGNPFGVGQTVTMGIISAVGRSGLGINSYENFIQTDAAINPGNSGGALVDAEGRLVGINTAIFSESGGYQGVGFAVPSNMARYVMDRITREGRVVRGFLGLGFQPDMTQELQEQFSLPSQDGALVTIVEPATPAGKAGFKEGDFLIEFNGHKVTDMRQLRMMIAQTAPGTVVTIKLIRDAKHMSLTATLSELTSEGFRRRGQRPPGSQRESTSLDGLDGVEVQNLDPRLRMQLGLPRELRGAVVAALDQDSRAADSGLRQRDIIVEINRQLVRTAEEVVSVGRKATGKRILLRVWRPGEDSAMLYIVVNNSGHGPN